MKRIGTALLLLSSVFSLGCGASINAGVHIYKGNVTSIHTPARMNHDLLKAQAGASSAQQGLKSSIAGVTTSAKTLEKQAEEAVALVNTITVEKGFTPFRDAWVKYIDAAIKELPKTSANPEGFGKALQAQRADIKAQIRSKPARSSDATLRILYTNALREELDPGEKDALDTLDVVLCWDEEACVAKLTKEQRALLAGKGTVATLKELQAKISAHGAPSTWALPKQADAMKAIKGVLASIKDAGDKFNTASWKGASDAMTAAIDTHEAAPKKVDGKDVDKLAIDKVATARVALSSLADDVASVKIEFNKVGQIETIEQFFGQAEVVALFADVRPDVGALKKAIDVALERARKAPGQIRAVAALGSSASDSLTDPNLKRLDPEDETQWSAAIDKLTVHASGESDFVIVQDSPTRFSVKQLRFDPAKNVQLGMSVADLGLDIATTLLQTTTGVNLTSGQGGQVTGDAGRHIADDCRASLRAMSANLGGELNGLSDDAKPVDGATLGRIRGMLAAQRTLVNACVKALSTVKPN